jgi:DNA-binding protein WhiA
MSFASEAKKNLCRIKSESLESQKSELSGLIRTNGQIHILGKNKTNLTIRSENAAVARLAFILFKKCFNVHTEIETMDNFRKHRKHSYIIKINDSTKILEELYILTKANGFYQLTNRINSALIESSKQKKAYLRGVFLGGGSVNDPHKSYHLELNVHNEMFAESLNALLQTYDLNSRIIARKNNYVIYIKESDHIVKFLSIIGAHHSLLEFENVRAIKEVRNNVNRLVNCETANLTKTVDAAMRHVEAIENIMDQKGLDYLSEDLQDLALLRLANQECSLTELSQLYDGKISKSSINYKLKKIEKISDEINKEENNNEESINSK